MVERFNSREPRYSDDADYTTNAPSYYDDLARKSKLLQLLAERIWEYDEELAKRFEAWDQNLDQFDDEVINLLNEWLDDGTLIEVIAQTIDYKSNIVVSEFEPENADDQTFWYKEMGTPILTGSGATNTIINTNVAVSDDEPTELDKNVWFDY